ncbi:MAG: helix-turn-helix domain-containing protein [bacterium]|nr:helix-turn-helix domain-containing protein [bacterium]
MEIKRALQNFGLKESEIRIYLASLELGESLMSDIANAAHITRSSCYDAIKTLAALGLINTFRMGARKLYKAECPEKLLSILQDRESQLRLVMPQLKGRWRVHDKKPILYMHEGREGFRAILNDILERQHPLCAITSIDSAEEVLGEDLKNFIERRHVKHLRVRLLTNQTPRSIELKRKDSTESRQTKFLPGNPSFTTANFIYGDRVATVSLMAKNPFGLIIDDPDIAQTQRIQFETVWDHSSF